MDPITIGLCSVALIVFTIYLGIHVAVALALTSFVSVWLLKGTPVVAMNLLFVAASDSIASYDFAVVPLFVLMGMFVAVANVAADAYAAANRLFRRLRGGLGVATVVANAMFAAVTGVSIASAAVFTKIAVPEMRRFGYDPRFAVGIVAGSSILGMLIPPSLLMIVFGILTEVSIGKLFIAGFLPGLLMTFLFSGLIVLVAARKPELVGAAPRPRSLGASATETAAELANPMPRIELIRNLWPVVVLIGLVMGGIYAGFFTPTEAGAVGALLAMLIAIIRRRLTFASGWNVLVETGKITSAICILVVGATAYSRMLAMTGLPFIVPEWIGQAGLGLYSALAIYILLIIVMGLFLDSISVMLLTVPITFPVFMAMGADPIWFGIVTIIAVEIGILTPPLGIALFVVKATLDDTDITLRDVVVGSLPFVAAMVVCLGLVVVFPGIVTVLLN